jgi:hypothetical protein
MNEPSKNARTLAEITVTGTRPNEGLLGNDMDKMDALKSILSSFQAPTVQNGMARGVDYITGLNRIRGS